MALDPDPLARYRPITSADDLRSRYPAPSERTRNKVVATIDAASARFIARSPLVLLSTADDSGRCYVSPRGGPPGFVHVVDEHHVALPDLGGNNRLDSFLNVVANGHAGLLFVVPGKTDALHLQGPAQLTDDAGVLEAFTTELRRPTLALVVAVEALYGHCSKAFKRSQAWTPDAWAALADAPDLAEIYATQKPDRFDAAVLRATFAAADAERLAAERAATE